MNVEVGTTLKKPKGRMLYSRKTTKFILLRFNFGQGGMKKLAKEIQHNVALLDAVAYGLHVYSKADVDDSKAYGDLWPYALTTTERGKVPQGKLSEVGNSIRETTGWSNPIDSLSVYAYIAKSKANEAMVEEKRKHDEETLGTSKRSTRANNKKEEGTPPKPTPQVDMEDAPKDKKQGEPRGSSYKLKSDIELAIDLKKVFEEHKLNSKVEVMLGDILGIAQHEFHEEIIDIIKRKQQIPSDHEPNAAKSQPEEIKRNKLQNGTEFFNVHSMDACEMLLQLNQDFEDATEDAIDIQVQTKYKIVAKKVKPVATPLPKGSNEVTEEAS
ncbi:hypothetical protein L7F22_066280 [Adiantum nelumboides]|nr:hypothetical protein [Adiantum nelumboides]